MSKSTVIILAFLLIIISLLAVLSGYFISWINIQLLDLIFAIFIAVIVAILINYLYKKYSAKSKMLQTTITPPPESSPYFAKLILKEKHEFIIKEYERIFGREDFLGVVTGDDLRFIGKKHFKISKKDDGFYIQDLDTKNGTQINANKIKGLERIKLEDGDNISVANVLNIKYIEKMV